MQGWREDALRRRVRDLWAWQRGVAAHSYASGGIMGAQGWCKGTEARSAVCSGFLCPSTRYRLATSPPHPADVLPSASHVSIRYLTNSPLSGTMPIELGSLASIQCL